MMMMMMMLILILMISLSLSYKRMNRIILKNINKSNIRCSMSLVPPDDDFFSSNTSSLIPLRNSNNNDYNNNDYSSSIGIIPTGQSFDDKISNSGLTIDKRGRSPEAIRYFEIVEKIAPNDMIQKFLQTAPKNVQEAAKSTVMTILGSLPNYALDAALITTSTKLANLLYQMQMTGYMFKNAEYRMTLTRSLRGLPKLPPTTYIKQGNISINPLQEGTEVRGEITVETLTGDLLKVDVQELTKELSREVEELRNELALIRNEREQELRSNLLTYIQALPQKDLEKLTSDMSSEVVESIQMLVNALMQRIGIDMTGPEVVLQQSVGALAQLCMWQMVVGYKLRELEALDNGASLE